MANPIEISPQTVQRMASRVNKKTEDEKKRRRRHGLFKKANELGLLGETDVYVVIRHRNRLYTYTSTDQALWPPTLEEIVSSDSRVLLGHTLDLTERQKNSYPLPNKKTPADFPRKLKAKHAKPGDHQQDSEQHDQRDGQSENSTPAYFERGKD